MENINKKAIFITLLLAIFTSLLVYVYITKATVKQETAAETMEVIVAVKNLPPKYKIIQSDLKAVKVTKSAVNPSGIVKMEDIVGKRVKESILANEQIVPERLMEEKKMALTYKIPKGMRAVSINAVEQMLVSNLIRPGDFVDIIASFEAEQIEDATMVTVYPRITKIVLQNVLVLAMAQDMELSEEKIKESPKTVTLSVSPQDAEKLVYASQYAVLTMALRPAEDNDSVNTPGVNREDVATGKGVYKTAKQ